MLIAKLQMPSIIENINAQEHYVSNLVSECSQIRGNLSHGNPERSLEIGTCRDLTAAIPSG